MQRPSDDSTQLNPTTTCKPYRCRAAASSILERGSATSMIHAGQSLRVCAQYGNKGGGNASTCGACGRPYALIEARTVPLNSPRP